MQAVAPFADLLYGPRRDDRLKLALMLEGELPVGQVIDKQQRPDRLRDEDLSDEYPAGEVLRPERDVEVEFPHLLEGPPACDRDALPVLDVSASVGLPDGLVGEVVTGTEDIRDLIVSVAHDRLLEGHEVGSKLAIALGEHPPTLVPLPAPSPQVERG